MFQVLPSFSFLPPAVVEDRLVEDEGERGPADRQEEEEGFVGNVDEI